MGLELEGLRLQGQANAGDAWMDLVPLGSRVAAQLA